MDAYPIVTKNWVRSWGAEHPDLSVKDAERRRERLRGKRLRPRPVYLLGPMAYVAACVIGVVIVLRFTDGLELAIGLTVAAFFVGHIPELFIEFKYSRYREEWELANRPNDGER